LLQPMYGFWLRSFTAAWATFVLPWGPIAMSNKLPNKRVIVRTKNGRG
jgi:hypothetical protein